MYISETAASLGAKTKRQDDSVAVIAYMDDRVGKTGAAVSLYFNDSDNARKFQKEYVEFSSTYERIAPVSKQLESAEMKYRRAVVLFFATSCRLPHSTVMATYTERHGDGTIISRVCYFADFENAKKFHDYIKGDVQLLDLRMFGQNQEQVQSPPQEKNRINRITNKFMESFLGLDLTIENGIFKDEMTQSLFNVFEKGYRSCPSFNNKRSYIVGRFVNAELVIEKRARTHGTYKKAQAEADRLKAKYKDHFIVFHCEDPVFIDWAKKKAAEHITERKQRHSQGETQ